MLTNDNIHLEILQDRKNGKTQPWRPKKVKNLILADSLHRLGYNKKANRVWWCSSALGFLKNPETGEKKLQSANFCRERLCPICQWRRSIKVFNQVSRVMDEVESQHKELVPIFLTLTVRNCNDEELPIMIDSIMAGWNLLLQRRKVDRAVKGWFRALEITHSQEEQTFHPHIHAILLVEKSYFESKDYMHTTEWVQMWRSALNLDYDPICDIRRVKTKKGKRKAVAEVAKYTLKDTDFLTKDNDLTDKLVEVLGSSLKGRRLFAFGGLMKQIAKKLNVDDLAEGDLVHIDEDGIREDTAAVLEIYRWNFGLADYVRDEGNFIFDNRLEKVALNRENHQTNSG